MSLSNEDRKWYMAELNKRMNAKILELLHDMGKDNLPEELIIAARARVLKQFGIEDKVAQIEKLQKEHDDYYKKASDANTKRDKISSEVAKLLEPHYVKDINEWSVHYVKMIEQLAQGQIQNILDSDYGPEGQTIAVYWKARKNLEQTVRLATSATRLRDFFVKFCEKWGLKTDDIDMSL